MAIVLLPVLNNIPVWDDIYFINDNFKPFSIEHLFAVLTNTFWQNSSSTYIDTSAFWRPMTSLVLWICNLIFDKQTAGFRMSSIAAALFYGFALYSLFKRLLPQNSSYSLLALFLSAITIMHPLSIEVVCMIANLSDHLAMAFLTLGLTFYMDLFSGRKTPKSTLLIVALLNFFACTSKEFGVLSLFSPLVAWILCHHTENFNASLIKRPVIWLSAVVPVLIFLILRFFVLKSIKTDFDLSITTLFLGTGQILYHVIVPVSSGANTYIQPNDIRAWVMSIFTIALISFIFIKSAVKKTIPSTGETGLIWAILLVLPSLLAITLVQNGYRYPVRYFHLAIPGVLFTILPFLKKYWTNHTKIIIALAFSILSFQSWIRTSEWDNPILFAKTEITYHPDSIYELLNFCHACFDAGLYTEIEKTLKTIDKLPYKKNPMDKSYILYIKGKLAYLKDNDLKLAIKYLTESYQTLPNDSGIACELARYLGMDKKPELGIQLLKHQLTAPFLTPRDTKHIKKTIKLIKKHFLNKKDSK
jgi:hypothetical protein